MGNSETVAAQLGENFAADFLRAYIRAALWSSTDEAGDPLDSWFDESDIAPETCAEMECDCQAFVETYHDWLLQAHATGKYGAGGSPDAQDIRGDGWSNTAEMAGHDFWLTRNRHGAGFWDRGLGKIGDKLAESARVFGGVYLYADDNGRIRA